MRQTMNWLRTNRRAQHRWKTNRNHTHTWQAFLWNVEGSQTTWRKSTQAQREHANSPQGGQSCHWTRYHWTVRLTCPPLDPVGFHGTNFGTFLLSSELKSEVCENNNNKNPPKTDSKVCFTYRLSKMNWSYIQNECHLCDATGSGCPPSPAQRQLREGPFWG